MRFRDIRLLVLVAILAYASLYIPVVHATGGQYRDYATFMTSFKDLANAHPGLASYEVVGQTVESRDIVMFKIGNPNAESVVFDGAMHGEENLGSELLYAYAKWLLTSNDPLANKILTDTYTLLIPALDVDEYRIVRYNAHHVDLNRNFATNWARGGSTDPTSAYYRGPAPLSEPESQTIINMFNRFKPKFYINLHRGGEIFYTSNYGNSTYYSLLFEKVYSLCDQLNVKRYSYQYLSGAGFAISDAANMGITSFLLEVISWDTPITLSEIETVLLPRFIPTAFTLSQECESEQELLFEDSFESGDLSAWDGTVTSSGETTTVVSTVSYHGSYSALHEANGYSTTENAYCFKNIPSSSELHASGSFMVTSSGTTDNDDRFYFITFAAGTEGVAKVGWRKVNGVVKWTLIIRDQTNYGIAHSDSSPSLNKWYSVQIGWFKDEANGYGELYVDGTLTCSITSKDTSAFGNVNQVRFGLAELYYCGSTTVYTDHATISTGKPSAYPPWDVNQDGKVDIFDIVIVASAHNSDPSSPNWNPRADVNSDGTVNIFDIVLVAQHYGKYHASAYTLLMPFDEDNPTIAADYSGYNNYGEITGATWTSEGIIGGAYEFDGNDVITVQDDPTLDGGGTWSGITVEFWIKPMALLRGTRIVAKKAASASTGSYIIGFQTSTSDQPNTLFFGVTTNGNWEEVVLRGKTLAVGTWYCVVGTYESGPGLTIYINGVQEANRPLTGTIDCGTGDEPLFLGYDGGVDDGRYLVGTLDEVKISPTVIEPNPDVPDPPTYSAFFGFSSYPRTAAGAYSTSVIDEIIRVMDSNHLNIYRMSFAPSVNPNPYVQYYLDNCDYDLIVDLWHLYPPGAMTDSQWVQCQNDVLDFCSDFANYQDRVWIEPVNERTTTDLAVHIQSIMSAIRDGGYSFNVVMNKMGQQTWSQMASISDPLDRFWAGEHYYFGGWSLSAAKSEMTTALNLGLKILNTEVGADAQEYLEFTQAKVDTLNEFLIWCAQLGIGNAVWNRYGLGNYPTYKTYGLANPLTEEPII